MAKTVTRDEAERKKAQAAAFMERLGESDRAEEFQRMSTDEYAEHRGLRLTNPKRRLHMAQATAGPTKTDLQAQIDEAIDILDEAYAPETTREDLADAVGRALETLRGEDEDEDEDADAADDDEEYEYSPGD
jgi:hypothetical protein